MSNVAPELRRDEGVPPKVSVMWSWIICYVTGHDYSVSRDHGAMFLKCIACGRRSQGWTVHGHSHAPQA